MSDLALFFGRGPHPGTAPPASRVDLNLDGVECIATETPNIRTTRNPQLTIPHRDV